MTKRIALFFFTTVIITQVSAQSFRIEDLKDMFGKGKPLKLNGGFSANSVFNAGNAISGRDPFAYYLNGNINLNIYGQLNLPFSFNFTNSGSSYRLPSSPNRLSIHPSYKWITGHIGDVSMTFSPYTLNGHIFTGAGVELAPEGWEFAVMYGRLQKAVEYDEIQPAFLPTYKRMGYGVKAGRITDKYRISLNLLNAKDEESSLHFRPDSLGITPMENLAGSLSFAYKPAKFIELAGEYGLSLLTSDTRLSNQERDGILDLWQGSNMSSTCYNAFKMQVNYVGETNRLGIAYERIDPDYKTLGAYYFTNDVENITFNAYQSMWQNKLNVAMSLGYENSNLSGGKANLNTRVVGSLNITGTLSERIIANLSYSNFQSFSVVRSDFELINQEITLDKLDTLSFVQISQSANLNLNLVTKKSEVEMHNVNINLSYQDAANKQGGKYQPGSVTGMTNTSASYTISYPKKGMSINGAANINNSRVYNGNSLTWGPTLGASSQMLKKKVTISGAASYNTTNLESVKQNEVILFRLNSSYNPAGRHYFTLAYTFQWRSALNRPETNSSLVTVGYNCNF
ncbi:hypothetical protein AGMMS50239_23280 [Bacteroidia bacterium]|nr:hypothetical protein AGMMS50239_23280 [Bacteroidia bacterium]